MVLAFFRLMDGRLATASDEIAHVELDDAGVEWRSFSMIA
jgi:hypothetical protein